MDIYTGNGEGSRNELQKIFGKVILYTVVGVACLFFLFPIFWIILKSFQHVRDIVSPVPRFFTPLVLRNYLKLFTDTDFLRYAYNTLFFSSVATSVTSIIASMGAYAIIKIKRESIGLLVLISRMCPFILYLMPIFIIFKNARLLDTVIGMSLSYLMLTIPAATWLLIGFFANVPPEVEEAALIDGASRYAAFFRVVFPQVSSGVIAVAVFNFAECWNFLLIPLIIGGENTNTLPIMILNLETLYSPQIGVMFAMSVLTIMPILGLIIVARRHIMRMMMLRVV